jgi:hypothetical protein
LSVHRRKKEKGMRENGAKNMPLPDKAFARHRSPICGKLSSYREEKANSIGFCTSPKKKKLTRTTHPIAIAELRDELDEKPA